MKEVVLQLSQLHFLSYKDFIDFQKDVCIGCNGHFNTRKEYKHYNISKSDCTGDCWTEEVTETTHSVTDTDFYRFTFGFSQEYQRQLRDIKQRLRERIFEERNNGAVSLREKLEQKLHLEPQQKKVAIEAILKDYLHDTTNLSHQGAREMYPLDHKLDAVFHNVLLGDLQLVWKNHNHTRERYEPQAIKSHTRCWSFQDVEAEAILELPYLEFYNSIMKNTRFAGYHTLFEEFPGVLEEVQQMPVQIEVKPYVYNRR